MKRYIISLGSNLGDRLDNLWQALQHLRDAGCGGMLCSSVYKSEAQGFESKHEFYNMVVVCTSALQADILLERLLDIESRMGRLRLGKSYSDRIIDLDLIDADGMVTESDKLTLPHPRLHTRDFVVFPLKELVPDWIHPVLKVGVEDICGELKGKSTIEIAFSSIC